MCIPVSEREVASVNYTMASCSGFAAGPVGGLANGPAGRDMACWEVVGRRVVAEICFLLLFVATLVETVVRLVMLLVALLPLTLCMENGIKSVKMFGSSSIQYGLDTAIRCLTALIFNAKGGIIKYSDLGLYEMQVWA